ncbi:MAG TPA: branched-chain amino acid ABC transporter permease [Aggregatilineales bacterium]|nr:branched-chain amino acid ABC transporter permease [Aggregatilineales bacterium]
MSANIRPSGVFNTTYAQDMMLDRTWSNRISAWGFVLLLLILPMLSSDGLLGLNIISPLWISVIAKIAIFAIAAQGLNIIMGYTGQISLGHAAFMAVGAYTAGVLVRELGFTFWTALPVTMLFTGIVGLIFGLPSLRVKGFYLAMATLAAQNIIIWIITYPLAPWTGGANAITLENHPVPFFGSSATKIGMYYIIIPFAVLSFLVARNLIRTRTGRAFISIRDNDLAAELLGINVFTYKLQAFFISSMYAGLAGALFAFNKQSVQTTDFSLALSIELVAMLVIGGAGFSLGPLFGASFILIVNQVIVPDIQPALTSFFAGIFTFVPSVQISTAFPPLMFGLLLALFLVLLPRGIAYQWEILKISWKIRPYSY